MGFNSGFKGLTETQQNVRCLLHDSCSVLVLKLKVAVLYLNCGFLGMTVTSLMNGYKLSADSTASIFSVGDRRHYVSPKRFRKCQSPYKTSQSLTSLLKVSLL